MSSGQKHFYEFGPFRIDTVERQLLCGDEPVQLTPKAYETLLALAENAGRALDKDELLRRVWPDTFVEEGSLTRNISVLRKALGDEDERFIETLPKRGYRFVAQVQELWVPGQALVIEERTISHVLMEETESSAPWLARRVTAGVVVLLIVPGTLAYLATRGRNANSTLKSLAVLPLKSLTGDVGDQPLELGLADSIIARVGAIPGLTVRPTSAIRKYLESADPLRAARELRVDAVLTGTMQTEGDRIRVSVNLLESSRGASLCRHAFDVHFRDIFELEDEVARQVGTQLQFNFDSTREARLVRHRPRNPVAYEHYLKGIYSYEMRNVSGSSRVGIESAIVRFKRAVELDPSYAQAYAQLAICYSELMNFYEPGGNAAAEAQSAASHAYDLDPDLPELRIFRAWMFWSWDGHYRVEDAIRELRRATGYNSSAVHSLLGLIYSHAGLDRQALGELQRAIEIDPTNSLHVDRLAEAYVWAGRYADARAAYDRALAIEPDVQASIAFSAIPYLYALQFDEARRRLERAQAHDPRNMIAPSYISLLAALQGNFREAETGIQPVTTEKEKLLGSHHAFYAFASVYALDGKSAEAVRWLRKTVETGMPNYPMFARDPNLARIRASPEFVEFMAELKPRWDAMEREFRSAQ